MHVNIGNAGAQRTKNFNVLLPKLVLWTADFSEVLAACARHCQQCSWAVHKQLQCIAAWTCLLDGYFLLPVHVNINLLGEQCTIIHQKKQNKHKIESTTLLLPEAYANIGNAGGQCTTKQNETQYLLIKQTLPPEVNGACGRCGSTACLVQTAFDFLSLL